MSFKKILIATLLLILLPFTIKVQGGDFGQRNSLFSDIKAYKMGDILTVNICENTRKSVVKGGPGIVSKYNGVPPFTEKENYIKNVLERLHSVSK